MIELSGASDGRTGTTLRGENVFFFFFLSFAMLTKVVKQPASQPRRFRFWMLLENTQPQSNRKPQVVF